MGCGKSDCSQGVVRLYLGSLSAPAAGGRSAGYNGWRIYAIRSQQSACRIHSGVRILFVAWKKGQAQDLPPFQLFDRDFGGLSEILVPGRIDQYQAEGLPRTWSSICGHLNANNVNPYQAWRIINCCVRNALVVQTYHKSRGYGLAGPRLVGHRCRCSQAKTRCKYVNGFAAVSGISGTHVAAVRPHRYHDRYVAIGACEDTGRVELSRNGIGGRAPTRRVEHNRSAARLCFKRYLNGHRLDAIHVGDIEDRGRHSVKCNADTG